MDNEKNSQGERNLKKSFFKAIKSFGSTLPMLISIVLLIGIFKTFVTPEMTSTVFTGNLLSDSLLGAGIGSISAGNPITSYIIGGELINEGVSLIAVTAFMVSWVTVGFIQFPAEAKILGKKFAITRNLLSFIFSILIALATVFTLEAFL